MGASVRVIRPWCAAPEEIQVHQKQEEATEAEPPRQERWHGWYAPPCGNGMRREWELMATGPTWAETWDELEYWLEGEPYGYRVIVRAGECPDPEGPLRRTPTKPLQAHTLALLRHFAPGERLSLRDVVAREGVAHTECFRDRLDRLVRNGYLRKTKKQLGSRRAWLYSLPLEDADA